MRYAILTMLCTLVVMAGMPAWLLPEQDASLLRPQDTDAAIREEEPSVTLPPLSTVPPEDSVIPDVCVTTVRLLHAESGEISEMDLDTYLYGVVFGEMPASFGYEALCAQAVAARSYTLYQMELGGGHVSADLCDDSRCCQNYINQAEAIAVWGEEVVGGAWAQVKRAVDDTSGTVLSYQGQVMAALYHASSYLKTEQPEFVWGGEIPYLISVSSPEEDMQSEVRVSRSDFERKLKNGGFAVTGDAESWISNVKLTPSGRTDSVGVCGMDISGVWMRSAFSLKSAMFELRYEDGYFVFTVHGSGHGVGMSQYGARALAAQGKTYREILEHYYPLGEIVNYKKG